MYLGVAFCDKWKARGTSLSNTRFIYSNDIVRRVGGGIFFPTILRYLRLSVKNRVNEKIQKNPKRNPQKTNKHILAS